MSPGPSGSFEYFQDSELLLMEEPLTYGNTTINTGSSVAGTIQQDSCSAASAASISSGVYFLRGAFVRVNQQTLILDQYDNSPSYRVGLQVVEKPINAKEDPSLYDNARGFSNYAAPGADRFSLDVKLTKKLLSDPDDKNFVELIRVRDGVLEKFQDENPEFNFFADALARRTYDESGDYYVRPFSIDVRESLNDRISNRGLYTENQTTQNGNTPSDDIYCLQMSPGKAYVRGYEVRKNFTSAIDVVKPRTCLLYTSPSPRDRG